MEDHPSKELTLQKPFEIRRKGRPGLRWVHDIEADHKTLGVRGWRRKALDRDEWRMCWRSTRLEEGCSAAGDDEDDNS
jgi:hypothetical protein